MLVLFVLPISAAEQIFSQILFSTLQSQSVCSSLYCSVARFIEATGLAQVNLYQMGLEWYFDSGL